MAAKLRKVSRPKSLHETPPFPVEIAGEKHSLRFDMLAVARLEIELTKQLDKEVNVMDILQLVARAASGGGFKVGHVLAVIAAAIAHEYEDGEGPKWSEIGEQLPTLESLKPLILPAMEALEAALTRKEAQPDPNAAKPAEESTGPASGDSPATS